MNNKRVHQKPRDIETRKRKKTVIISAEGKTKLRPVISAISIVIANHLLSDLLKETIPIQ